MSLTLEKDGKKVVLDLDSRKQHIKCKMYETLTFINHSTCAMNPWWYLCKDEQFMTKKCICIIRLYLQVNRIHEPICKLCYTVENPVPHITFRCVNLQEIRDELWANLEIPLQFRQSIEKLNYVDRTVLWLRAFNVKYVRSGNIYF